MPNRQYIRFYIDRNYNLRAIWYNERKFRYPMNDGYNSELTHDMTNEPLYAVRSVKVSRSCDKYLISKVRYCYTVSEAEATIDSRIRKQQEASPENITVYHMCHLIRAPRKYVKYFLDFVGGMYGEDERDKMTTRILKFARWFAN